MLVLSRHRDESIMIGDDVVVTIVDIRGDKVRLGIEAPGNVRIVRKELLPLRATEPPPPDTTATVEQPANPGSATPAC